MTTCTDAIDKNERGKREQEGRTRDQKYEEIARSTEAIKGAKAAKMRTQARVSLSVCRFSRDEPSSFRSPYLSFPLRAVCYVRYYKQKRGQISKITR